LLLELLAVAKRVGTDEPINCSVRMAADMCGVSKSHAATALATLEVKGFIVLVRRGERRQRRGFASSWRVTCLPFRDAWPTCDYNRTIDRERNRKVADDRKGETKFFTPELEALWVETESAPTVIERNDRYMLVAGRHRLEALRVIGRDPVQVRIVDFNDVEARLWTISENLHRNELTALQRAEQVAEFVRLSEEVRQAALAPVEAQQSVAPQAEAAHVAPPQKRYEQRGDRLAARDLWVTRDEVRRARTIAALSDMAKAKAADLGLDRNQSALIAAA
jgi:hypothetical protein